MEVKSGLRVANSNSGGGGIRCNTCWGRMRAVMEERREASEDGATTRGGGGGGG